ncbi:MAG: T9SS type A sorting domain-containing protein [Armatimonadetes bacterium]|nr:T9SS type A sorting domain-containing protein [Armatimonadota bacterium]
MRGLSVGHWLGVATTWVCVGGVAVVNWWHCLLFSQTSQRLKQSKAPEGDGQRLHYTLLLALWLLLLACHQVVVAQPMSQDATVFGRRYLLAFPSIVKNTYDPRFPPQLGYNYLVFAYSRSSGTVVTITPTQGDTAISATLTAGVFSTIPLPDSAPIESYREVSSRTFLVEATNPVVLYCYVSTPFGGEAWTPIPIERWGMEYRAAMLPSSLLTNVYSGSAEQPIPKNSGAPGVALILATHDSTEVIITPGDTLVKADTIILLAKQVYQYATPIDTQEVEGNVPQRDLGGAVIRANRPIGVLSGNTRQAVDPTLGGITRNTYRNLLVEWLPPTEQYGHQFIYLPTQDFLSIPEDSITRPKPIRTAEYARAYGRQPGNVVWRNRLLNHPDTLPIAAASFREVRIDTFAQAIRFATNEPALMMMHSSAAAFYHDTVLVEEEKKQISYDTWSPYMVEMTPREQWPTFAPLIAPTTPPSLEHYVSVVTDSASVGRVFYRQGANGREYPFGFNRGAVPESDLVWGTMQILPGQSYSLRGADSSARFYGVVYGVRGGKEWKRVHRLLPTEYQEQMAISYGYPLAPMRRVATPGDTLEINTEAIGCYDLACHIRLANFPASGFQSIQLAPGATNTRLLFAQPNKEGDVLRASSAEFTVTVADTARPAQATVVVTDRTGQYWTIPYSFTPTTADFAPVEGIHFGNSRVGFPAERVAVIKAPAGQSVRVRGVWLNSNSTFRIAGSSTSLPAQLKGGDSLLVRIKTTPTEQGSIRDTLNILLQCARYTIPVTANGTRPCVQLNNLMFDTLFPGDFSERELRICNTGDAPFTLTDPTGNGPLTWQSPSFTIPFATLQGLRGQTILPGECIGVIVRFSGSDTATYQATARLWSDSWECDSLTRWEGRITAAPIITAAPQMASSATDADACQLLSITPNPTRGGSLQTRFRLSRSGIASLSITDPIGRVVAPICQRHFDAGEHQLTSTIVGLTPGIYFLTLQQGTEQHTHMLLLVGE